MGKLIEFKRLVKWIRNRDLQIEDLQELANHRGGDLDMYVKAGIFFVPTLDEIDDLENDLGVTDADLGVTSENDGLFEDGFIIPVRNGRGNIVFWINYSFKRDKAKKYINILSGTYVNDGEMKVYGLHNLKKALALGKVAVVEGVFDAILLTYYGIPAIALLGTKITDYHKDLLGRFDEVIYVSDNDSSGDGAWRKFKKTVPQSTRYTMVSGFKDPDELHKNSRNKFYEWLEPLKKMMGIG